MPSLIAALQKLAAGDNPAAEDLGHLTKQVLMPACDHQSNLWRSVVAREDWQQTAACDCLTHVAEISTNALIACENEADLKNYLLTALSRLVIKQHRSLTVGRTISHVPPTEYNEDGEAVAPEVEAPAPEPPALQPELGRQWVNAMAAQANEAVPVQPTGQDRPKAALLRTGMEFVPWRDKPLMDPPGGQLGLESWQKRGGGLPKSTAGDCLQKLGIVKSPNQTALWPVFCAQQGITRDRQRKAGVFWWLQRAYFAWKPEIVDVKEIELEELS